jgi:hypothetical protein
MLRLALILLCPHLGFASAHYASLIERHCGSRGLDPLLVAALIYRESRCHARAYSQGNWGLLQVRVSHTTNPELRGREHVLWSPERNLRRGCQMLSYWKRYHERRGCKGHRWWAHWQWGKRVRSSGSSRRVAQTRARVAHALARR